MTEQNSDKDTLIVIDTYAWIEYFRGSEEGERSRKFIEGKFSLSTPSVVIAELSDKYRRDKILEWETRRKFISVKSKILQLVESTADRSGELKNELRKDYKDIGLADAMIVAHAEELNAKILTGDKHLKDMKQSIDITK